MNILITGGFGNIGMAVLEECLNREHDVTVFELKNVRAKRLSKKYARRSVKTIFGDIKDLSDVSKAVENQDAVIHLAAILPPLSNEKPELCRAVNVNGICNLLSAIERNKNRIVLVEVSSASVMGPTQSIEPPVKPNDRFAATDVYSRTKIDAEEIVESTSSCYCILRLAAVLPTKLNISYFINMIKVMYDMPLDARCEIVLDIDVAHALVSAAENLYRNGEIANKKGFIAGGNANGCQMKNGEMLKSVFKELGLQFPRETLFANDVNGYYLDWYDTIETQRILGYQNHSCEHWKTIIKKNLGKYRILITLLRQPILKWLESQKLT